MTARTVGSLTAADLGKTVIVGEHGGLLSSVMHYQSIGTGDLTRLFFADSDDATLDDADTPCEVTP